MSDFFVQIEKIIRYLASGGVALFAAHLYNNDCLRHLNQTVGASATWWPMLFLAATIGLMLYAVSVTLTIWPAAVLSFWLFGKHLDSDKARPHWSFYDHQRWLRRVNPRFPELRVLQQEISTVSAFIHFLYCSGMAFVFTPLVCWWVGVPHKSETQVYAIVLAGLIAWASAFVADVRKLKREIWITEAFVLFDPTFPNATPCQVSQSG